MPSVTFGALYVSPFGLQVTPLRSELQGIRVRVARTGQEGVVRRAEFARFTPLVPVPVHPLHTCQFPTSVPKPCHACAA